MGTTQPWIRTRWWRRNGRHRVRAADKDSEEEGEGEEEDAGEAEAEPWRRPTQGTPERFPSAARKNEAGAEQRSRLDFSLFRWFHGLASAAMRGRLRRCLEIQEHPRGEDLGGAANEGVCSPTAANFFPILQER
jgi:hypothetical protein